MNSAARIGSSSPLGATIIEGGANFSLFSRGATGVELLFFDNESDARPSRVIHIDPAANRTYHYWHVFVPGVEPGQIYGYRVQGASDPSKGMRFDPTKVLLDPYGRGVVVPWQLQPRFGPPGGRQRRDRHEKCRGRSASLRLGRRYPV